MSTQGMEKGGHFQTGALTHPLRPDVVPGFGGTARELAIL